MTWVNYRAAVESQLEGLQESLEAAREGIQVDDAQHANPEAIEGHLAKVALYAAHIRDTLVYIRRAKGEPAKVG